MFESAKDPTIVEAVQNQTVHKVVEDTVWVERISQWVATISSVVLWWYVSADTRLSKVMKDDLFNCYNPAIAGGMRIDE